MPVFEFDGDILKKYTGNQAKVTIPAGTRVIGVMAFDDCTGLKELVIPNSVVEIRNMAIIYCDDLERIAVVGDNFEFYTSGNCLIDVEEKHLVAAGSGSKIPSDGSVISIGDYVFAGHSDLNRVAIPEGIVRIGESAFCECDNLVSVDLPSTVTLVDYRPFIYSENLTCITVADGNPVYHSAGNCLIETESRTLLAGCLGSTIPADGTVTAIGNEAFAGCKKLKTIHIPHQVLAIGRGAFENCAELACVTIENPAATISDDTFAGCGKLTIRAAAGSVAQKQAKAWGIPFAAI